MTSAPKIPTAKERYEELRSDCFKQADLFMQHLVGSMKATNDLSFRVCMTPGRTPPLSPGALGIVKQRLKDAGWTYEVNVENSERFLLVRPEDPFMTELWEEFCEKQACDSGEQALEEHSPGQPG